MYGEKPGCEGTLVVRVGFEDFTPPRRQIGVYLILCREVLLRMVHNNYGNLLRTDIIVVSLALSVDIVISKHTRFPFLFVAVPSYSLTMVPEQTHTTVVPTEKFMNWTLRVHNENIRLLLLDSFTSNTSVFVLP